MEGGGIKELAIVIKGDVHGSVEALRDALLKLSTDTVKLNVILSGVGAITKDDVMLAKASNAIILGFHVRPDPPGRNAAEEQGVDIRVYKIIYEIIDDVNPESRLVLHGCKVEPALGDAPAGAVVQFERLGYFARDRAEDTLVFHRTVGLRDEWKNIQKRQGG